MKMIPHPDPMHRCENIEQHQTSKMCQDVNFNQCPTLDIIIIKVCDGTDDGTSDNVRLKFFTGKEQTCTTGWINAGKSLNTRGDSVMFSGNELGNCGAFRFYDKLSVKIEIDRWGWNAHYDGYNFCLVEAVFGKNYQNEQTRWNIGQTGFCDGCGHRVFTMKIVN